LIYENEMKDYFRVCEILRYNSYTTTKTTLEFTKNVKDVLKVSIIANLN